MYRSGLVALCLPALVLQGGCDVVFGLTEPGAPPPGDGGAGSDGGPDGALDAGPPRSCFVEPFSDPLSMTWDRYAEPNCAGALGAVPCGASQAGGQLVIQVNSLAGYAGAARPAVNFTGAVIEVDAVPMNSYQPYTSSYLQIALDATNDRRYMIEVDADGGAPLLVGTWVEGANRTEAFSIAFDPQQHRLWQLAQIPEPDQPTIAFATRASSTEPWTRRGSLPVLGSLTAVIAELGAGRYAATMTSGAQTYAFDDFRLCTVEP